MSLSACAHTHTHTHKCAHAHTHLYIYSQRVTAHLNVTFSVKLSLLPVGENNCCNLVLCFHISLSWYKQSCLLMSCMSVNRSLLFDSEQSFILLICIVSALRVLSGTYLELKNVSWVRNAGKVKLLKLWFIHISKKYVFIYLFLKRNIKAKGIWASERLSLLIQGHLTSLHLSFRWALRFFSECVKYVDR